MGTSSGSRQQYDGAPGTVSPDQRDCASGRRAAPTWGDDVFVPLTIGDFLERAEMVAGDRPGVIDEPDAPGGGRGTVSYARLAELARAQPAGLDEGAHSVGGRLAIESRQLASQR